jgi:hypothetical protein
VDLLEEKVVDRFAIDRLAATNIKQEGRTGLELLVVVGDPAIAASIDVASLDWFHPFECTVPR